MKATEMANKPQRTSRANRGAHSRAGLDLETKIFSASGRGGTFFLTSLFIELIEWFHIITRLPLRVGVVHRLTTLASFPMCGIQLFPHQTKPEESPVLYRLLATSECSTALAIAAAFVSALVGSTFIPYS